MYQVSVLMRRQYFAAAFADEEYFTRRISESGKLRMPLLAMGGEASFAPDIALQGAFEPVAANLTTHVIVKSGHWIVSRCNIMWI